jgi:hypothetical protein
MRSTASGLDRIQHDAEGVQRLSLIPPNVTGHVVDLVDDWHGAPYYWLSAMQARGDDLAVSSASAGYLL